MQNDLRADLVAVLTRVYFATERKGSIAEDMADAVLEVLKRWDSK